MLLFVFIILLQKEMKIVTIESKYTLNSEGGGSAYYFIKEQTVDTRFGTDDQFTISFSSVSPAEVFPKKPSLKYQYFKTLSDILTYSADGKIKDLIVNSSSTDADLKPYANPSKISVFGSGYQFATWGVMIRVNTGSTKELRIINFTQTTDTFYTYMFADPNVSNKEMKITLLLYMNIEITLLSKQKMKFMVRQMPNLQLMIQ